MLSNLVPLPKDSILGLAALARADERVHKIDLTVGVYMNEQGICPVMSAVQQAQQSLITRYSSVKTQFTMQTIAAAQSSPLRILACESSNLTSLGSVASPLLSMISAQQVNS